MSFNTKNYQDGDNLVIGGTLELKEEATLIGFPCVFKSIRQHSHNYCRFKK